MLPELTADVDSQTDALPDAGRDGECESVAVPLVVIAVPVPVDQVTPVVTKGGVAIDMVAGRANLNADALEAIADGLVVVQVVVAG